MKHRMISVALFATVALSLVSASGASAEDRTRPLDAIVAIVNDEVITRVELDSRVAQVGRQLQEQKVSLPAADVLDRQVLERMIVDRAQMQLARENGLKVDDQTLDRAIARIAEQNKVTLQQFRDRLERDGLSFAKVREDIRDEILLTRLREREVDSRVQVTDVDIEEFLRAQKNAESAAEANIGHILVRIPEGASPADVEKRRQRALDALKQVRDGGDFARIAASFSDGFEATRGGEMGWRKLDRYPQLFVDTVRPLKQGEVSDVVRSPAGFHVLKLLGRRNDQIGLAQQVVQTHVRHILLRVGEAGLNDTEAQRRLAEYKRSIDAKTAEFADLAKRYSRDGSAGQGGDLGWVYAGDTVPEFERVMNALQPGQVSDPIQTPFGWHLIEVLERKNSDVSADRQRQNARMAVHDRKAEEAFADWAQQLRDRAYVEIRLDTARN